MPRETLGVFLENYPPLLKMKGVSEADCDTALICIVAIQKMEGGAFCLFQLFGSSLFILHIQEVNNHVVATLRSLKEYASCHV